MRDSLELIEETLNDYSNSRTAQTKLLNLVESLYKNLEAERSSSSIFQEQIKELCKSDSFGLTSKLAVLREDYDSLKAKLAQLKDENEDLNIQLIAKSQESKKLLEEKEDEIRFLFTTKFREKDEELNQKVQELNNLQESLKQKEQYFHAELESVRVSSNFEINIVTEEFQKQLNESNQRLKDSMETCNILRKELMSVKEQLNECKRTSMEKISELQKRLRENQNVTEECSSTDSLKEINNVRSRYQPLDVSSKSVATSTPNFQNKKIPIYRATQRYVIPGFDKETGFCENDQGKKAAVSDKSPVNRPSGKYNLDSPISVRSTLPALAPLTKRSTRSRKRKLYNPDDLSHLEGTEEN